MEGTLYGFAAVLTGFLLGIALGSALIAPRIDRIPELARSFALLHLAIAVSVAAGMHAVPFLPYAFERLGGAGGGVHASFALVLPLVLVPTALFGAAFPLLIRLYARDAADVGRAIGVATAANTAGSIAASLLVSFWCIPRLGMDASLYALVMLDLAVALAVLRPHQRCAAARFARPRWPGLRPWSPRSRSRSGACAWIGRSPGVRSPRRASPHYRAELARRAATQTLPRRGPRRDRDRLRAARLAAAAQQRAARGGLPVRPALFPDLERAAGRRPGAARAVGAARAW